MKRCKNDNCKKYKGTESTPLGQGYCSSAEVPGTIKLGRDGRLWEVKVQSSGRKRWVVADKYKEIKKAVAKFRDMVSGRAIVLVLPEEQMTDVHYKYLPDQKIPPITIMAHTTNLVFLYRSMQKSKLLDHIKPCSASNESINTMFGINEGFKNFFYELVF